MPSWLSWCCVVLFILILWTWRWLWIHHSYHKRLGKAVCALESVIYDGVDPAAAAANRICGPNNPPDGYGHPPPPPGLG